ncbi:polycomb group protein EMBRYONIC FLOWER 2-like, partial [Bidens hawaiensis]|uniref:polycomb group protein EMBRYONIC FLOWER 2-like n=1 Tax=Bidens hawaiensis TaxID=980011 RepID=UPI00404B5957
YHFCSYFSDSEHILSQLPEEEREAAKESLSVYLRPLGFYDLIQDQASRNPSFLTRCLRYKIEKKNKRKVQLSVSTNRLRDDGLQTLSIFPLYVLLARSVPTPDGETQQSSKYRFKRACKVTAFDGALTMASKFVLHEINKLSEVKPGSLAVLLVSFANQTEIDLTDRRRVFPSKEGYCLMGKSPVDFVHFSKENSPDISLGEKAWLRSTVSLRSCCMKVNLLSIFNETILECNTVDVNDCQLDWCWVDLQLSCSDGKKFVSFKFQPNSEEEGQVPVAITAQELWAKDIPLLDLNSTHNPLQFVRPRTGKVVYIYKYYDNELQRTEVKEDYTCPICTLNYASFMGLKRHLPASHDLFNYEFLDEGGHQPVAISIPTSSSETVGEKLHTGEREFFFCRRPTRRMGSTILNQNANRGLRNPTAATVAGESSVAAAADDDIVAKLLMSYFLCQNRLPH